MKVIRIKSQVAGFRRCNIAHSDEWTEYPKDRFSEAELKRLKAEPMLWVEEVAKKAPEPAPEPEPDQEKK